MPAVSARQRARAPRRFVTYPECGGKPLHALTREGLDALIIEHLSRCERCVAFAQGLTVPRSVQLALDLEAPHAG
jgi:hypothetical protein